MCMDVMTVMIDNLSQRLRENHPGAVIDEELITLAVKKTILVGFLAQQLDPTDFIIVPDVTAASWEREGKEVHREVIRLIYSSRGNIIENLIVQEDREIFFKIGDRITASADTTPVSLDDEELLTIILTGSRILDLRNMQPLPELRRDRDYN